MVEVSQVKIKSSIISELVTMAVGCRCSKQTNYFFA